MCVLLLWCAVLIAYRVHLAHDSLPRWLAGNLCLAAAPVVFSSAFQRASARRRPVLAYTFLILWLLFLPNAPYILTDLVHLSARPNVPLWYDLALLLSCGGAGALLGYISLMGVQKVFEERFGNAIGWGVASGALVRSY